MLLATSSNNYFTGLLKVGNNLTNDCYVSGGTNPGLVSGSCNNNGASDAILTTGVTLVDSFVGKVTVDDAVNASDSSGTATYPADPTTFDWTSFENSYRGWGIDGSVFPDADNRDQWTTGTGRIWDWSLALGDTGDAGSSVIKDVLAKLLVGDAANTITHIWTDTTTVTSLRNASEIADDGIGNDNGLCETSETCLYTGNISSYQGHGTLQSAGAFTPGDGTITGVTLLEYDTNGY